MTADVVQTVIQIINGCGFPIAACVGMAWFIVWNKKQAQENKKYNYENLREAIDNNTKVMQETAENDLGSSPYGADNGCPDPLIADTCPVPCQMM